MDALIVCIGDGRIVLQLGLDSSLGIVMIQQSFWKLLHQMIYGFGMLTLGCLGLTMTSMSCRDHLCLLDLQEERHHL